MRFFSACLRWLCPGVFALGLPLLSSAADLPENVVARYHFVGATALSKNSNIAAARAALKQRSSMDFVTMVMHHTAVQLANTMRFETNAASLILFRPLLEDAVGVESVASLGGVSGQPFNAVFGFHLQPDRLKQWQINLKAAGQGAGQAVTFDGFTGWQWNKGAPDSFWMVEAKDWLLIGRGENLAVVRSDYLQQIQKTGRPASALDFNCFEADVDWPRWTNWFSLDACPLKLGRMQIALSAQKGGFKMVGHVTYPQAIQWQQPAMSFPTNLVHDPLLSFTTGQNVEPFLKSDETLSRLPTNPFRDQFYFWSMRDMALQSYMAWPAADPTNTMVSLSAQALDEFNPLLEKLNGSTLVWYPKSASLGWTKIQMGNPALHPAPPGTGNFLLAGLFPPPPVKTPAPAALWTQLSSIPNLVYYDWEMTGRRTKYLLTVTQLLPVIRVLGIGPEEPLKITALPGKQGEKAHGLVDPRLSTEEAWLANLDNYLGKTATEVTKSGPNEVTIIRDSPFVFSSLELILFSHWISDTPAGPLDWSLLPQAKMSGPGVPH